MEQKLKEEKFDFLFLEKFQLKELLLLLEFVIEVHLLSEEPESFLLEGSFSGVGNSNYDTEEEAKDLEEIEVEEINLENF